MLEIGKSIYDAGIDDPEAIAFVNDHSVDGEESVAVWVGSGGVRLPIWVWSEGWRLSKGW